MKQISRLFISLLMCMSMLVIVNSSAALAADKTSGKCGSEAKWSYSAETSTLTISGKGSVSAVKEWEDLFGEDDITVVVKNGITKLDNPFGDMYIKSLSLPKTLTTIKGIGYSVEHLSSITIPKSVKTVSDGAFGGCRDLKSIKVEKGSKFFASVDGVLFNESKKDLIACPIAKKGNFTIPKNTKTVHSDAFMNSNLKKLTVPSGVKTFKRYSLFEIGIRAIKFQGKVPKGLAGEANSFLFEPEVSYPKKYSKEWKALIKSCEESGASWKAY